MLADMSSAALVGKSSAALADMRSAALAGKSSATLAGTNTRTATAAADIASQVQADMSSAATGTAWRTSTECWAAAECGATAHYFKPIAIDRVAAFAGMRIRGHIANVGRPTSQNVVLRSAGVAWCGGLYGSDDLA